MDAAEGSIVVKAPVAAVYRRAGWRLKITQNLSLRSNGCGNWTRTILSPRSLSTESNMTRCLRSCCVFRSEGWPGELFPTVMRPITLPLESFPSRRVLTERHALLSS